MKVAILGVGHWGRNHLKVYSDLKEDEIIENIILYDKNNPRSKQLAKDFGIEYAENIQQILQNQQIKMVSIVTPSNTHFQLTKKFLEAGKDVLVEKPLSMTSMEGWELIRLAQKLNRILLVGHIFRFHNAIIELKRIIQRGDLGEIIKIQIDRSALAIPREDMGVIHALAIHDVDIPCFLLNQDYPKEIGAFTQSYYREYPDEMAIIFQRFENGTVSISNESWLNPIEGKTRKLIAIGTRGSIKIDLLVPDTLQLIDSYIDKTNKSGFKIVNEGIQIRRVEPTQPLRKEISHFVDCSLQEKSVLVPPEVGVRALEMIEMAFKSIEHKRMININEYIQ